MITKLNFIDRLLNSQVDTVIRVIQNSSLVLIDGNVDIWLTF